MGLGGHYIEANAATKFNRPVAKGKGAPCLAETFAFELMLLSRGNSESLAEPFSGVKAPRFSPPGLILCCKGDGVNPVDNSDD
jgi:hypothetical protein